MLKRLLILTLPALVLLLVSCGGDDSAKPSEKNLRIQIMATWAALQQGDHVKLYSYLSADTKSHCTLDQMRVQTQLVRGSVGDQFLQSRLYVDNVVVVGERVTYESTNALNGVILSTNSRAMHWEKDHWVADIDPLALPNPEYPCTPI